jgi:UDP:flavonoid glycosyltransferase YjiC (YdhE family)
MATIALFPEPGAWGPTNNLVAIAQHLKDRGHRCVFVTDLSFAGVLEAKGFEEASMRMAPAADNAEPGEDPWSEFIRVTAPEFRKPTIEQIATVTFPIWEALIAGERYSHHRLMEIWDEARPDVVITDNVTGYAAVELAGVPWIRMVSANPLEMRDPDLPPPLSGYPIDDRSAWEAFRAEFRKVHRDLLAEHNDFRASHGVAACEEGEFASDSPWLNLYLFPAVADYPRSLPLDETWHRLESTVRTAEAPFDVGAHLPGDGGLIYLSLGSLGCMDVALMQRLIDELDRTDHRVIVSLGPLHEQLRLGQRMYGEPFLPQPSILPQCDLLITHGGNNTTTEGFHFGLPMIALPLFWDQYDNAQRLRETGFGARLPTYDWEEGDLATAVDGLLGDDPLRARMRANAEAIRARSGSVEAADLIERVGALGR